MTEDRRFEEMRDELEEIVRRLESVDVPVDDAIALFARGQELYRLCAERLDVAELRLEELVAPEPGTG